MNTDFFSYGELKIVNCTTVSPDPEPAFSYGEPVIFYKEEIVAKSLYYFLNQ